MEHIEAIDKMGNKQLRLSIMGFLTQFMLLNRVIGGGFSNELPLKKEQSKIISEIAYAGHNLPAALAKGDTEEMKDWLTISMEDLVHAQSWFPKETNGKVWREIKSLLNYDFLHPDEALTDIH